MLFRKKDVLLTLILFVLITLPSCSKKSDIKNDQDDKVKNEEQLSDSNFTETNEDLLTVDYKQFYDELSPHGEWVQVNAKDLGIDLNNGEGAGEKESGFLLNDLFGIKSAYADDFNFGMFFVWRPSPNLAVSLVAGEAPVFVPYSNGQWIYTDDGWYFRGPTPYEEITYHYGRWVFDPFLGWVWVPGRVWAPAWVEWRVSDDCIGWAPLPPTVYIVNNVISPCVIHEDRFIFVEQRHFCDPFVYKHSFFYKGHEDRIRFKEMTKINGVMVRDNKVINGGPEIGHIEKITGKKFNPVKVNRVDNIHNTKYAGGEINSYSPHFSKTRETDRKETVSKPKNYVSRDNAGPKEKKSDNMNPEKNAGSNDNNNNSPRNNGNNKDNKGNNKEQYKGKQDNNRSTEKYNGRNEQKSNDKGNNQKDYKQKGNDKGNNQKDNKQKGNDKGNNQKDYKQKGNDKGNNQGDYKQKGNDKDKSNDKGSKQKKFRRSSNDKGNQKDYTPKGNDKGNDKKQYRSKNNGRYFNNAPTQKNDTRQRDNQPKGYTREKNKQSNNDYGSSGNEKSYDKSQGNGHSKRKR